MVLLKRKGQLFETILEWDNLRDAVHRAMRGKRDRVEARSWLENHDQNLRRVAEQVREGAFVFGRYHQFFIHDPKKRLITAPCFEERIVHHAIINVLEPHLERWLIDDTYACRKGKGVHACLDRAQHFARAHPWFLKLDIRKYFDSISHSRLQTLLERRFKDARLLAMISRLIGSYCTQPDTGVPIGSLTSQHFANFYLGWLDRWVKENLLIRGYLRYMDDMAVWTDSYDAARSTLDQIRRYASTELLLELKPEPYINRTSHGMDFLGCRIYRTHRLLNRHSRVRFRRKLTTLSRLLTHTLLTESEHQARVTSLTAVAQVGVRCWHFRCQILKLFPVSDHEAIPG